jgi:hypothetical protein
MKPAVLALLMGLFASIAAAQGAPAPAPPEPLYPFIVVDSPPRFFTMRQVNQDFLSGYRLFARETNARLKPAVSFIVQGAASVLLLKTMTHEEGHQAILTGEGIESHSRDFLFMERAGYVDGVTDAALKNLRDTKFPTFIRLHTAGFESDYMLATREETLLSFEAERYDNLVVDYVLRKSALLIYFTEGLFKRNTDGPEEADELERDIVGNDLYGVIRHLFRPTMEYRRYTRLEDLTGEERQYLERVQWRTFLNLANANLIGIRNVRVSERLKVNVGLGHCMGPFGDFIDQKFWLDYRQKWHVSLYAREFENRDHWFFGAGGGIDQYPLARGLRITAMAHYWNQPVDLSFNTGIGKSGGAVDISGSYELVRRPRSALKSLSLDAGVVGKTAGFLPEEIALDGHVGVRFGLSVSLAPASQSRSEHARPLSGAGIGGV